MEAKKLMAEEGIIVEQDLSKEAKIKEAEAQAAKEAEQLVNQELQKAEGVTLDTLTDEGNILGSGTND